MIELSPVRLVDGLELPVPGTWIVDPLHTSLGFESRHVMVTRMRGRFRRSSGSFTIAERPEDSSVELVIQAASVDTNHPAADEHLRGEHFLDVANHPTLTYRSTEVRHDGGDSWWVTGDLTIRGVTRPITLAATLNGVVAMSYGPQAKFGFTATGAFDRRDFGIDFNIPLPGGGVAVGHEVRLTLDVEADLPHPPAPNA